MSKTFGAVRHLSYACRKGMEYVTKQKVFIAHGDADGHWIQSFDDYVHVFKQMKYMVQSEHWKIGAVYQPYNVENHRFYQLVLCNQSGAFVIALYSRSRRWQCKFVKWLLK